MSWENVSYTVETLDHPHVSEFLTTIGSNYVNGGVILRSFRPTDEAAFDDSLRNDFRDIDHPARSFLTCPSVVAALPELQIEFPLQRTPEFRWGTPFGMEGDLTHLLLTGGAYERFRGTIEQARSLSRRFMEALFGEELHWVGYAGRSRSPWTPWFYDGTWDNTFVVLHTTASRFVLLCMTDRANRFSAGGHARRTVPPKQPETA